MNKSDKLIKCKKLITSVIIIVSLDELIIL